MMASTALGAASQRLSRLHNASPAVRGRHMLALTPLRAYAVMPQSVDPLSQQSVDPMGQEGQSTSYSSGRVLQLHSRNQFEDLMSEHPDKLLVLMAKASHCRPCKCFARKYSRLAQKYEGVLFADVMGDESMDTRRWMMDMSIKSTPTFNLYRGMDEVASLTGTNDEKLVGAILSQLLPSEVEELGMDLLASVDQQSAVPAPA